MNHFLKAASLGLALPLTAIAQSFVVNDIRVEGLQRVSAGTVFAALPVRVGDQIESLDIQSATRALFRTGYFQDIQIGRENGVLVITVRERPAISKIEITGNKAIKTEDLLKGMEENGLAEGQIFKRATLEGLAQELQRQYVAQGRYGASVKTEVKELPRNQVELKVIVDEGAVAAIKHINIVGNAAFSDEELAEIFELQTTGWLSWLRSDDKYSREKLTGDLERLESYYLDRGYLEFKIDSTQVSLSPDKRSVFITINVTEGDIYKVSEVELAGDPVVPEEEIRRLLLVREGQTFSQVLMTTTSDYITKRLGNEGYTFAEVNGIPEPNEEDKTVKVTFFIDPGKRAYVRRINFRGNTRTADEVLRREMRQMEAASASSARIEQSKVRLERLGFFKEVEVETTEVPGTSDQIDVEYTVEEQPSGTIGGTVGYAQSSGLVLGANVQENNWLGTGKSVGFAVNTSVYQTVLNFSYTDPYFTPDGVSRGFNVYYQERDYSEIGVSSYNTTSYGAGLSFGYPISEISRVGLNLGVSHLELGVGETPVKEIKGSPVPNDSLIGMILSSDETEISEELEEAFDAGEALDLSSPLDESLLNTDFDGFVDLNGENFDSFTVTGSYARSTLNRGILATRGTSQRFSLEVALPGGDLEYYKAIYTGQYFRPLTKNLTLRLRTRLGYADSYGDTTELPFFENFYAGGFGSVRGFERNSLGPRSTPYQFYNFTSCAVDEDGISSSCYIKNADTGELEVLAYDDEPDPFGGNILIEGSAEIIFPLPFVKDQRSMQSAFFIDAGNVFDSSCGISQLNCYDVDLEHINVSAGVGLTWITGFGPLTFSLAKALEKSDEDEVEVFQFSLGNSF
ncbi:outer membrane protein assembly factor BamA [Microbulbifer thermotolerans]|uniref:Outer membrane protein assembly factor BamA n=1 Tax=Microbulbifer thermotolerans TaxID=252514 RepID=A0A143HKG5_MICTH|nr:outer membrane protein assembly factor BamA [Microbulbifer thermotolerans]AMX02225.1 outer membrane protein assembly factor BamA [Microbulbifer thermotolerans]MCX2830275.1 outer membrane protein assembly factor BamA [Microbulbifer thermotolerans]MCX2834762.1 outer membrane protein assembly factor BamA [Microbulbifer thermotolerans]WKT61799.1 outer membrane protein assembly factor BamA [Microbulbifer thermotolerans]SFB74907.1 Beta-barrel assembly machine subunit BamA [Microbulbifer thermotol